jgi:MFS transporter, DHA1 family, chloramphenicol/florfenicol resistance protein
MRNYKTSQLVFTLTPFVFSFAFGLDIYIPIVPQMAHLFATSQAMIQLTLSLFLFTTGVGQLFIGPLADQFGRKKIFFVSSLLFALGSLICASSTHITWLIAGRFISSLGACGMLVTSFALVRDLYTKEESAKMYSFLNGAIGISPTFAPILGGYLSVYFGWQAVFLFLTLIGLLALFTTALFVEETLPQENRVKFDRGIFHRYWNIVRTRQFFIFATLAGLAEGVFFCFFSISPFIIIDLHGIPTHEFGYYFAVFGLVISLGGVASGKTVERIGISSTIGLGIFLMLLGGLSMIGWHLWADPSLKGFLIPMVIACTGAIFVVGGSASAALEPFPTIAGTASAAFGAFEFGISALIGSCLMLFPTDSTIPYGISIVMTGILAWCLFIIRLQLPKISSLLEKIQGTDH